MIEFYERSVIRRLSIEVEHKLINLLGYNTQSVAEGGLNSPYDAKRIGNYTGITPPFDHD